jgi:hypothetical protein
LKKKKVKYVKMRKVRKEQVGEGKAMKIIII